MKRAVTFLAFLIISCAANPAFAKDAIGIADEGAFDRTAASLKTDKAQRIVRTGQGGIEVICTVLPTREALAVGWEINNPGRRTTDIEPDGIKVFDRVREYNAMTPGEAVQTIYGTKRKPWTADPFLDANAPSSYVVPDVEAKSEGVNDMFLSAFNFGKTDAERRIGFVYYPIYGRNVKVTTQIKIGDETLKFDFE